MGEVEAQSYVDHAITFPKELSGTPVVMVCFSSSTDNYRYGNVSVGVLNRSETGVTIRVWNGNSSANVSPSINWIAIATEYTRNS